MYFINSSSATWTLWTRCQYPCSFMNYKKQGSEFKAQPQSQVAWHWRHPLHYISRHEYLVKEVMTGLSWGVSGVGEERWRWRKAPQVAATAWIKAGKWERAGFLDPEMKHSIKESDVVSCHDKCMNCHDLSNISSFMGRENKWSRGIITAAIRLAWAKKLLPSC